jgi:predicted transcriptional regulator
MERILMELSSLLDIASIAGLVSEMNAAILQQEFNITLGNLSELRQYCNEVNKISNDFFNIDTGDPADKLSVTSKDQKFIKDNISIIKDKSSRKESREKAIIDIIRTRGNVNIKDISKSIRGCSEKTIQRKLISLIKGGVIKKDGERRWSRYSLI